MELPDNIDEFSRASIFCHDFPEPVSAYRVKRFCQVDVGRIEVNVLFLTLFLELSCCEDHVNRPPFFAETTLTLRKKDLLQMVIEAIQNYSSQDLACIDTHTHAQHTHTLIHARTGFRWAEKKSFLKCRGEKMRFKSRFEK